jgi:multimeric flavodoxin WrbA
MATANDKGDIAKDEEGLESARALAKRMAHLLKAKGV